MSRRRRMTRNEQIYEIRTEWKKYGSAIIDLMDRIDKLEKEADFSKGFRLPANKVLGMREVVEEAEG